MAKQIKGLDEWSKQDIKLQRASESGQTAKPEVDAVSQPALYILSVDYLTSSHCWGGKIKSEIIQSSLLQALQPIAR